MLEYPYGPVLISMKTDTNCAARRRRPRTPLAAAIPRNATIISMKAIAILIACMPALTADKRDRSRTADG